MPKPFGKGHNSTAVAAYAVIAAVASAVDADANDVDDDDGFGQKNFLIALS